MPNPEKAAIVIHEWVVKAENDLRTAVHTLKLEDQCPTDTVCFHAQQCVEKYIKALLVLEGIDFPKTHALEVLLALLPSRMRPDLSCEEQEMFTEYATGARYPGWGEISLGEARQAVAIARRVRKQVRGHLPKGVLRLRKH